MKAWHCRDKWRQEDWATVVFAETRGKARAIAMNTDACEDARFVDIEIHRVPELDKCYRGKDELDWNNMEDRVALVKECGFYCSYEVLDSVLRCEWCPAKEWCMRYQEND